MSRYGYFLWIVFLGLAALLTLACGMNGQHLIQSISVSPSSADAKNYPNGQVPFIATGDYKTPPLTVTPLLANWGTANLDGSQTTGISVAANGVAQCAPDALGTYSVGAWVSVNPNISCNLIGPYGDPGCNSVLGTALLTCP